MALYQPQPTGSGKLTPVWPDLVLRFSTDGFGLVFEDPVNNFLLVWNADYINRAIEYSPGLFTPVLVAHTATTAGTGGPGGLINPGPATWNFSKALPFEFEKDIY